MDVLAELESFGLQVTYEQVYPEGGGEPKTDKSKIRGITFPLTDTEWCELCMRDGQFYVGGCCGQTSAIQDLFIGIFRDSGAADAKEILELMQSASRHDGFEEYALEWSGNLEEEIRLWDDLNPIKKIGLCCQAVKAKLHPLGLSMPFEKKRKAEPEDWCRVLEGSLQLLRFRNLIRTDGDKTQKHANQEELLARMLPACKKVLEEAIPNLSKPFKGFAVVKKGTADIQADGYGICVYATENKAKQMVELWKKHADEDEKAYLEKLDIKPVTIDSKAGIVWK